MSCDECKEQVFELIEREAVDPEGVRAILDECPDCRAEFEALKASLALAAQLPLEEPPADLDAAILSQASLRVEAAGSAPEVRESKAGEVVPLRKRLLQAPPWAMAAVALLAVGVGVWAIPREVQLESDLETGAPIVAEAARVEAAEAEEVPPVPSEEAFAEGVAMRDEAAADDGAEAPAAVAKGRANRSGGPARKQAARAKKRPEAVAQRTVKPETDREDLALAGAGAAPEAKSEAKETSVAMRSAADVAASAPAPSEAAFGVGEGAAEADSSADARLACRAKVEAFENRLRDERRFRPAPEEQLAMGRCYQTLGDEKKARIWLERAAEYPKTKERATAALRSLSAD
jgi:hypothetical protein